MSVLTAYDKFIQQALKYGFSLFGLPPTGQTIVYKANDDGTYQKGYPRQGPRFTDNGDGTITDNATGLMWVKDPSQIGGVWGTPGTPSTMHWNDAIDNSEALNYAGHSDWRLPNFKELISLVDYSKKNPAIDATFFPNTDITTFYWTSTTFIEVTTSAIVITFIYGAFSVVPKGLVTCYPRPVRLGYPK